MEARQQKLVIVGCGGIGGVLCGHLSRAGHAVTMIAHNPEILATVHERGMRVGEEPATQLTRPEVVLDCASLSSEAPFDIAFLAVPPTAAEQAARDVLPLLGESGQLVCLPNGLMEERLAAHIPQHQLLGGVVGFGARMLAPGHVMQTSSGGVVLGRLRPEGPVSADQGLREVAEVLACVQGPIQRTDNLRGARWSKLAINCAVSGLGAVGGERLGVLMRSAMVRALALEIMTEVVEVARAEGVRLKKVAGTLDLDWVALPRDHARKRDVFVRHGVLLAVGARFRHMRSSMLASLERGRTPPVAFLNGEVASRGEARGIATPANDAVVAMIEAIARGERRSGQEALREVAAQVFNK